jgi:nitroimidazol reductase NimA-like FMN-containing flavoprotein (pyridoxamine 5'-phosphate oxidase superfamily)
MSVDDARPAGISPMNEAEIRSFVSHRNVGILALPADGAPYVIPMSFDFDGEDHLYFTFVVGEDSHKATLSDRAEGASFLVYDATSAFIWESVVMSGDIDELREEERSEVEDVLGSAWRPEAFRDAGSSWKTKLYRFRIDETVGLRGTGLPDGLGDDPGDAS